MRMVLLIVGATVIGLTVVQVLKHVVMVPVDEPAPWVLAVASGLTLMGIAIMPVDR